MTIIMMELMLEMITVRVKMWCQLMRTEHWVRIEYKIMRNESADVCPLCLSVIIILCDDCGVSMKYKVLPSVTYITGL